MANKKISALPLTGSALSTDEYEINQGGVSKKVTASQMASLFGGLSGLTADYIQKAITPTSIGDSRLFDNGTDIIINGLIPDPSGVAIATINGASNVPMLAFYDTTVGEAVVRIGSTTGGLGALLVYENSPTVEAGVFSAIPDQSWLKYNFGIGNYPATGIKLDILGDGTTSATSGIRVRDSASTDLFIVRDDGNVFFNKLNAVSGSTITVPVANTFIDFVGSNASGIRNARIIDSHIYGGSLEFVNDAYIESVTSIRMGNDTELPNTQGFTRYFQGFARLGGNANFSPEQFPFASSGMFFYANGATGLLDRFSLTTPNDKIMVFGDGSWSMPIGTSNKAQFDADESTTASILYTQAEVQAINDRLLETRQTLAAVVRHLGNQVYSVTADNTTDEITMTGHDLIAWRAVKFISGTMPTGLTVNTKYYIRDAAANVFKLASSIGGSVIDFTTNGANLVLMVYHSGENILKD